jgi:hypothetical protein
MFRLTLDKVCFLCILQKNTPCEGGQKMMVRVIYKDQSAGVIESHLLETLIRKGRIVAYHSADRWIPVEPKTLRPSEGVTELQRYRDDLRRYRT